MDHQASDQSANGTAPPPRVAIKSVYVDGYKCLNNFIMRFNDGLNIIVGDNESGKSSILEAINLAITGKIDDRPVSHALHPHIFNQSRVSTFFLQHQSGTSANPPSIRIEVQFYDHDIAQISAMMGGENIQNDNRAIGLTLSIHPDPDVKSELDEYLKSPNTPHIVPVEYYICERRYFSGNPINHRTIPVRSTYVDTSRHRSIYDPDRHLESLTREILDDSQRRELSAEFRRVKQTFEDHPAIQKINTELKISTTSISQKAVSLGIDLSPKGSWEKSVTSHLDKLPFSSSSKGEQSQVKMKLALKLSDSRSILLIEEPENHQSHSKLNELIHQIDESRSDRQAICTTHSSFVLNKLGLDSLHLLSSNHLCTTLSELNPDTVRFFKKVPGFSTLRLLLSPKSILTEGISDELIVQRAYIDKYNKLPIEDGVDIISAHSLSFKRYLEISKLLNLHTAVVTDNDGNIESLKRRYAEYINDESTSRIRIFYSDDESARTLEYQICKDNDLATLNKVFGRNDDDISITRHYMTTNKSEWALRVFESDTKIVMPEYVNEAISYTQ